MQITIMAIGSRGDVQPLVALGAGLQRRGHQVRLVAGDEFAPLVAGTQLSFMPLGINIQAAMEAPTNIFRFAYSITDKILKAAEGKQDAIVSTILGVSTCQRARDRGIPFFYTAPIPGLRTREFPDPLFPPLPLGGAYNLLTYRLTEAIVTRAYPYARSLFLEPRPTYLFCYSPTVVPQPTDWERYAHVTGYWFLDRPLDWQPPAALVNFLKAGPPPVCVGFGSMLSGDPQRMTALVLDALTQSKQRGLLVAGWGGLRCVKMICRRRSLWWGRFLSIGCFQKPWRRFITAAQVRYLLRCALAPLLW
jgi:UDP:flavonoid glycosyltransferase YjiC (YdhE family)